MAKERGRKAWPSVPASWKTDSTPLECLCLAMSVQHLGPESFVELQQLEFISVFTSMCRWGAQSEHYFGSKPAGLMTGQKRKGLVICLEKQGPSALVGRLAEG